MTEFLSLALEGKRELINGQRLKELVDGWATNPSSLTLSNKSFDCDAATALVEYLNTLDGDVLRVLDMSDVIAGRPEEEALAALRIMCGGFKRFQLVNVNLSDNALGAKGINACKDLLEQMPLQKLFVCNDGLSAESVEELGVILRNNTNSQHLRVLHFYNNMSGTNGAIAFSKIINHFVEIEDLRYSATRAGTEGCMELAKSVTNVNSLKKLDFMDNTFGAQAAEELAKSLAKHTQLESLNLRDDYLKSQGVVAMTKALQNVQFPLLKTLDLSGNELNAKAVAKLTQWIVQAAPNLETLLLDDNELGSDGAVEIAKLVKKLPLLKKLSLSVCEIGGNGGIAVAKAVKGKKEFNINLNGNFFKESALEKIQELVSGLEVGEFDENDEDADEDDEEEEEQEEEEEEAEEAEKEEVAEKAPEVDALAAELDKVNIEKN